MDILADVMKGVIVRSAMLYAGRMRAPWGVAFPRRYLGCDALFHVVTHGSCLLEVEGRPGVIRVSAGDLILLPQCDAHCVRDAVETPIVSLEALREKQGVHGKSMSYYRVGGDPEAQDLGFLCGKFYFENGATNPLIRALPPILVVRGEPGKALPWLEPTLTFLSYEAQSMQPGAETVISRLCDILFVQAVRAYILTGALGESAGRADYLRALADPDLGPVLQAIHQEPSRDWTVADLATHAAMSRSAFAARFTEFVGESPLQYVTRWRIHVAAGLLREDRATLREIAARVGYSSEASLSNAFKRLLGVAPGAYRQALGV